MLTCCYAFLQVEDWKPQVFLSEISLTAIQEKDEICKAWLENRKSLTGILFSLNVSCKILFYEFLFLV
jgi:hypothetical protein